MIEFPPANVSNSRAGAMPSLVRERSVGMLLLIAAAASLVIAATGCASRTRGGGGVYAPASEAARNPLRAQELNFEAADLMQDDPEQAEKLLRQALTADLYHGPAHNNLGVLHLGKGELYEAAHEFEWARKLMPGHPDPRMNLALTLERAGRIDEALATYETALEVHPGHAPSMQALARLQIRHSRTDDRTSQMLSEIALSGETLQWRDWARQQMIRLEAR